MDIKSAFLQGKPIEKDIYLKPSKEAHTKKIWKLDATVYGLGDTQRPWYLCVKKNQLSKTGDINSKYNKAIFYWHQNNQLRGILSSNVNDFFWAGRNGLLRMLLNILERSTQSVKKKEKYLNI